MTSDTKKTKTDIAFVYAAYSLRYFYLLLLIPYFSRVLGPEGYGVVLAAMSLMQVVWLFVNWGFSLDGLREIATMPRQAYPTLFSKHAASRILLSLASITLGGVAIILSSVLSTHWLAGVLAIILGIVSAFNLGWYFNGSARPRQAVKLEVMGFALNLIFILLLVKEADDANLAIASILASGFISLCLAHWWIKDEIKPVTFNWQAGLTLIKTTSPIFVYSSSAMLLGAASTYLLSTLSTADQVGYFGSAERLVSAGLSMMAPMGAVFIPKVTVLFQENADLAFKAVKKVLLILVAVGLFGLLLTTVAGAEIVALIFGDAFMQSTPILQTLAIIFPFYACTLVLSTYVLIPLKHERLLAKITIFGAMINLVIAVPLATHYEGAGMAYARVISETVTFSYLLFSCYRLNLLQKIFYSRQTQ